jgi:hypothetical protein
LAGDLDDFHLVGADLRWIERPATASPSLADHFLLFDPFRGSSNRVAF